MITQLQFKEMSNTIQYGIASSAEQLQAIINLQGENLPQSLSDEEKLGQGFVTVQHELGLLQEMAAAAPQIIALGKNGELAGYALGMLQEFADRIPILFPMFEQFSSLSWKGKPLSQMKYLVMGQVCVAKAYRGQKVFDGLYQTFKEVYQDEFDLLVTQIDMKNTRSLRAHERVGLQALCDYHDHRGILLRVVGMELA